MWSLHSESGPLCSLQEEGKRDLGSVVFVLEECRKVKVDRKTQKNSVHRTIKDSKKTEKDTKAQGRTNYRMASRLVEAQTWKEMFTHYVHNCGAMIQNLCLKYAACVQKPIKFPYSKEFNEGSSSLPILFRHILVCRGSLEEWCAQSPEIPFAGQLP